MVISFADLDGFLLEPLKFDENDKKFLKNLKKASPEEIIILNELKGRGGKISYQWIKIRITLKGLIILLKVLNHFGDYIAIYKLNHQIISELPKSFLELLSLNKVISENEIIFKLEELIK